ncbi:TPA: hypothetical protein DD394_01630 [bacterium UBP9_UBA11836]|nr:hypothetical protein [bacterium UBP9_UBA11836]
MSGKRILLVLVALTLWLPLVVPAFFKNADGSSWQKSFHTNLEVRLASRAMRISQKCHLPAMQSQVVALLDEIDFDKAPSSIIHNASSLYYLCHEPNKALNLLQKVRAEEANSVTEVLFKISHGQTPTPEETQSAFNLLNIELKEALDTFYNDPLAYSFIMQAMQKSAIQPEQNERLGECVASLQHKADRFLTVLALWGVFSALSFILLAAFVIKAFSSPKDKQTSEKGQPEGHFLWKPIPTLFLFVALNWLGACLSALLTALSLHLIGTDKHYIPVILFSSQMLVYIVSIAILALTIKYVCEPDEVELSALSRWQGIKKSAIFLFRALRLHEFKAAYIAYGCAAFALAGLTAALMSLLTSLFIHSPVQSNNIVLAFLLEAPEPIFWLLFFLVVSGPLYEEIIYRGLLFSGLSKTATVIGAAFISSLMFSSVHGDPQGLLVLAGLGMVFCAIRHYTGSLWPSVIAHALWNCQVAIYVLVVGR